MRELRRFGKSVRVILTKGAGQFVSSLNFEALGAERVYLDSEQFGVDSKGVSLHLSLSRWADAIVIAPASADFISKVSLGFADGLSYVAILAHGLRKNVFIAPAMNNKMWENPITQRNVEILKRMGVIFIGPDNGELADRSIGKGRLSEVSKIAQTVVFSMNRDGPLSDKKVVVTCGATKEYIDPVRFITNGSSGLLGSLIAMHAKLLGANVHLIAGSVRVKLPYVDKITFVETTEDLLTETRKAFDNADILIMSAAPVDFKPERTSKSKIKKLENLEFKLVSTPDILKNISHKKGKKIIVGFALQTEELEKNAIKKMKEKNMDIVVANSPKNIGSESGSAILMDKDGNKKRLINMTKDEIAVEILNFLKEYMDRR